MQVHENKQQLPSLFVFFGMIGSGKSYLGKRWAQRINVLYYNSDEVRKELAGLTADSRQWLDYNTGIYSPEFSRKTYDELIRLAEVEIEQGKDCAIDATYTSAFERELVAEKFAGRARVWFVLCECSEATIKERLDIRASDKEAASDGRWMIYEKQKEKFGEPQAIDGTHFIQFSTEEPVGKLLERLVERYGVKQ